MSRTYFVNNVAVPQTITNISCVPQHLAQRLPPGLGSTSCPRATQPACPSPQAPLAPGPCHHSVNIRVNNTRHPGRHSVSIHVCQQSFNLIVKV